MSEATQPLVKSRLRRISWASKVVIAITLVTILYVLSSGPMVIMATTRDVRTTVDALGREDEVTYLGMSDWWQKVYLPLVWVAEKTGDGPLQWYWGKFFG